jgi:hypothetical protein
MDHFVVLPRRMKTGSLSAVGGLQAEDGPGSPNTAGFRCLTGFG